MPTVFCWWNLWNTFALLFNVWVDRGMGGVGRFGDPATQSRLRLRLLVEGGVSTATTDIKSGWTKHSLHSSCWVIQEQALDCCCCCLMMLVIRFSIERCIRVVRRARQPKGIILIVRYVATEILGVRVVLWFQVKILSRQLSFNACPDEKTQRVKNRHLIKRAFDELDLRGVR